MRDSDRKLGMDRQITRRDVIQGFGRIAIANSDAGALAMVESAVEQAHRATTELLSI